jgi:diacylglycerol kinase family enzyme
MIEKGRHLGEPEVACRKARAISMTAAKPIYAHLDGEVITAPHFEAEIFPGMLLVRRQPAAS